MDSGKSEKSDQEENLLMLLRSGQERDVRLGLTLAANPTIQLNDLTDLIAVALFHRNAEWRELGEIALSVHASKEEQNWIRRNWEPTDSQGDTKPFFSAVGKLVAMDRVDADHLYRLATRYTWRFPKGLAHKIPTAFLEYCESNITPYGSLNLSGRSIPVLPPEIAHSDKLRELESLSMVSCDLRRIPAEIAELNALVRIDLSNNQLRELPEALGELQQLKEFNWTHNPIRHIPSCLPRLKNVRKLILNVEEGYDFTGIAQCQQFRDLELRFEQGAGEFPQEMLALTRVERLNAYGRRWDHSFPEELAKWQQLRELELFFSTEHTFPRFVRQLQGLRSLKMSMIPKWEVDIPVLAQDQLREIELKYSLWKEWPESWCDFPALEQLVLYGHKFEALPEAFSGLRSLRHLSLIKVPLQEFPTALFGLPALETLELAVNDFTALPEDIGRMKKLRTLKLAGSEIRHLPHSLRELKNLRNLELRNLKLNRIEVKELVADMPWTNIDWS